MALNYLVSAFLANKLRLKMNTETKADNRDNQSLIINTYGKTQKQMGVWAHWQ